MQSSLNNTCMHRRTNQSTFGQERGGSGLMLTVGRAPLDAHIRNCAQPPSWVLQFFNLPLMPYVPLKCMIYVGVAHELIGMFVCVFVSRCKRLSPCIGMLFRGMSHQSPEASSETPSAASGSGRRRQAGPALANQKLWRANGEFVRVLWPAHLIIAHAFPSKGYPGDYDAVIHAASDRGI